MRSTVSFGGSCDAKTVNLSAEEEQDICATCSMFGTLIEIMVVGAETLELDFEDDSLMRNMRCAYPLHYISNASETALGGPPKNVVMLTCDACGVLAPFSHLTPVQARQQRTLALTSGGFSLGANRGSHVEFPISFAALCG